MPSIGDRVEIAGTGTFWDGKRGKVEEEHPDGTYSVAVAFGDGNETLQDFDGGYLEPIGSDEGNEGDGEAESEAERHDKRGESMDEDIKWEETERNEVGDDARRKALADYLGIDAEDVEVAGGNEFDTPEGDYLVLTEDEAYDKALEDIQGAIDELGLGAFTENFRDYILNSLLDDYHIKEEAIVEYYYDYAEDIKHEPSDKFENRLIEELYEKGILTDDDFEDGEDGKDHYMLKPSVDLEAKEYEYAQMLSEDVIVSDWLYDTFGDDVEKMSEWLSANGYIDWDEVKRQCIRDDGVAHFIASYDGEEIELEGDLYAYRIY